MAFFILDPSSALGADIPARKPIWKRPCYDLIFI